MSMKRVVPVSLAAMIAAHAALADAPKPMHAYSFDMSDRTVVVFYTEEGDEYEVTTTIGPHRSMGGPITRYVTRLERDESYLVSVAQEGSKAPVETLEIRRLGDDLRFHASLGGARPKQARAR